MWDKHCPIGKRAQPVETDETKLNRLVARQRVDTRRVEFDELDELIDMLGDWKRVLDDLRHNRSVMQQTLAKSKCDVLVEVLDLMDGSEKGKASATRTTAIGKMLFPELAQAENAVGTMKAIYSSMVSDYMAAYALEFYKVGVEDAVFDNKAFKSAVEGILKLKTQEEAQKKVNTLTASEIEQRAVQMARRMLEQHLREQSAAAAVAPSADVAMG